MLIKKIGWISFLLALILCANTSFAQKGNGDKKERIKAYRVAFMTEELALTPEESEKFWPLYNEFKRARKIYSEKG